VYFYPSVSVLLHNLEVWDASYLARNFDKKTTGRETDLVFGNIKETGRHFVIAHQGFTASIIIIKNVVPF
jgi:hypothetical protein